MKVFLTWILTCLLVFQFIDAFATRHIPVRVEDFRQPGMTDEQVLSQAVQEAYTHERNVWWINDKEPFLVFDARHDYEISTSLYAAFDLEITTDAEHNMIGILRPAIATVRRP